jgi:hypothetical protein
MTITSAVFAQKQVDSTVATTNPLIPARKAELLKDVDIIANMQFGLNNDFTNGQYDSSRFSMNQFRLEIKGKVFDKVYFRFRNRYTKSTDPQSVDNLSNSTDLAYVGMDLSSKVRLDVGKLCAAWGGYEFDANPIYIYQYNDIVNYADNFLAGVQASWKLNDNHILSFQILNSRTKTFQELYDSVPGITEAKFPAAWVVNWDGSFAGGKFKTLWSYSVFTEAQNTKMYYLALGNQLALKNFQVQYDFKWSKEDLDRTTVVSSIVPKSYYPYAAQDVLYVEHWLHVNYHFSQWNFALVAMVSDAYWYGNPDQNKDSHLRSAWGLIPSIEYYPLKKFNLKFFADYTGRYYNYTDYAKKQFGAVNTTTGRLTVGFICPLLVL